MTSGFVYIITHDSVRWRAAHPVIKIGKAININKRIAELNTASPINLILVASIQSKNAIALEHHLHMMFAKHRLNGEWFELNPLMITTLRQNYLNGDRFDELFDFSKSSEQLEIERLKTKIDDLNKIIYNNKNTIDELKSQLELYTPKKESKISAAAKEIDRYKFFRQCRKQSHA